MGYLALFFLAVFLCSTGTSKPSEALRRTAQRRRAVSRRETPNLPPPYLNLPVSVDSRLPLVAKDFFAPAAGTGMEPLPEAVREVLIPTVSSTRPLNVSGHPVNAWCEKGKMFVQVSREILGGGGGGGGGGDASAQVNVGTCRADVSTTESSVVEFDLKSCGISPTTLDNEVILYSATLQYDPPRPRGPIRRVAPFNVLVECHYNKNMYSYKIGYTPIVNYRKIFKPLRSNVKFILTARNAQWERLSPSDEYVLGQPMYFEVEAPSISQNKRLYIQSCYVTPQPSHNSTPQFPVVENFGCMVESKDGRSRFIPYIAKAARFSVDAFMFRDMSNRLFMHCNMSEGSTVASPVAKSCNYDTNKKRWVELYGSDSVCACCESTCSSIPSPRSVMISSRPWTINPAVKPAAASKRKAASTTRTTLAAKPQAISQTSVRKTYLQSETSAGTAKDKAGSVWMHSGSLGVEGMAWIEEEEDDDDHDEEKFVVGSAVLEEEDEPEEVTDPLVIFEELFGFDK